MKATVIFGSPRANSNTKALLDIVLKELETLGNKLDFYNVYDMKISGCRACLACQENMSEINCVIDDEMQPILKSITDSDSIIISAPVYAWGLPAPVKAVVDRMAYSSCKYYGIDPHGPSLVEGKKLYIITSCGYPVEKGSDLLEESMIRVCKHFKMVYGGMLAKRHRNLKEPFMDEEKEVASKEFAKTIIGENL